MSDQVDGGIVAPLHPAELCLSVHISHTDPIAIETVPLCYFYCEANVVIKAIVVI